MTVADVPDVVVARATGDRNVFFPDLARLDDGSLVAVHYSSRQHMHTPDSTIRLVRGSADGRRWDDPITIIDNPGLDDRDPSICQLRSGRILVTWFRRVPGDLDSRDGGSFCMHSDDGAVTWSAPVRVPTSLHLGAVTAPPIELVDGRLLFPGYDYRSATDRTFAVRLAVSRDQGESWDLADEIEVPMPADPGVGLVEPALSALDDDTILMVLRSRNHPENLAYASWSEDRGATWSVPTALDFAGHAPDILTLDVHADTGRRLITWGEYHADDPRTRPVRGRIVNGYDRRLAGETFTIHANPDTVDMSYPSAVLLDPTTALVIHYDAHRGEIGGNVVAIPNPKEML